MKNDWKIFNIDNDSYIACQYRRTRQGFCHRANLIVRGEKVSSTFCSYRNRTWESYDYQSVLRQLLRKEKYSEEQIEALDAKWSGKSHEEVNAMLGSIAMVAKMGEILAPDQKSANDWKKRMLNAGLGNMGLSIPEDWDTLSEDEKQRRLDGAIEQLKK